MQRRLTIRLAAAAVAAGLLAGGTYLAVRDTSSSEGGTAMAAASATDPTSTTPTTMPAPVVTTKTDARFGTILADGRGMTLYTLTANGKPLPCTGQCAANWPPLEAAAGVAPIVPGVSGVGVSTTTSGAQLVTHNGLPLYRFVGDTGPADAKGEGLMGFGGVWHVNRASATAAAATAAAAPAPRPTTPPTTRVPSMAPRPAQTGWPRKGTKAWTY